MSNSVVFNSNIEVFNHYTQDSCITSVKRNSVKSIKSKISKNSDLLVNNNLKPSEDDFKTLKGVNIDVIIQDTTNKYAG